MNDVTVTASELARTTSALLDQVERGRTVAITRRGRPVALLVPNAVSGASVLGCLASRARQVVSDDEVLAPIPDWEAV